jgi:predicted nucleic acid-binding protein
MNDRTFFDTNVLVYLFDADSPIKQARARLLFQEHVQLGRIALSPQVLQEFYVTVTRKLVRPLAGEAALAALAQLSALPLVAIDGALILRAVQLHQKASLSFWDALIVQAALEGNCKILLSEDMQHGRRFGDLAIQNPFAASWRKPEKAET